MKEILVEALQSPQCIKFISTINQISLASKNKRDFQDPDCDIFIQVDAECLEHTPGEMDLRIRTHKFTMDMDKKIFFWSKVADRYNAINHDVMFEIARQEVEKVVAKRFK
jgi:hypothetical protein